MLGAVDLDENGTIEMTVKRGGEKLKRTLTLQTYTDENGAEVRRYGFTYGGIVEATPLVRLQYSWYNTLDFVRLVRMSLMMLVSGSAGLDDLSGPVGIVSTIKDVGEEAQEEAEKNNQNGFAAAAESILYFGGLRCFHSRPVDCQPGSVVGQECLHQQNGDGYGAAAR